VSSIVWGALLILAVVWPGRLTGPLDGAPLDTPIKAVLLALVLPLLWFLAPAFLKTRAGRAIAGGLLLWKIAGWLLLTQTGLCATFLAAPQPHATLEVQRSWDVRTLWSRRDGCTAIQTRPYLQFEDFPAWSINLLPDTSRPPAGSFALRAHGVVEVAGKPPVTLDLTTPLTGTQWRFAPQLEGADVFRSGSVFVTPPSRLDRAVRAWGRWVTPALLTLLLIMWAAFAYGQLRPDATTVVWTGVTATVAFLLGIFVEPPAVRFSMLALLPAAVLPVPRRMQTLRHALLIVGVPWLAFYAGRSLRDVGHFLVYTSGDDWWTYQRHAYEIFMQGRWFEGGEKTFWNQPLYRWTAGTLHLIFGDSSAGEMYLDAAGITVGAMFAFDAVSRFATFRYGVLAAALVFNVAMLGPNWYGIGRGLSEISAVLCVYLAAFALLRARARMWPDILLAGLFAALAFFTRLNQLILLCSLVLLLLPDMVEAGSAGRLRELWRGLPKAATMIYLSCVAIAVLAIAMRTWHYTGHFSLFLGTQRDIVSTGLGLTTMFSAAAWHRALESVAMIVTVQDPPRFDPRVVIVTIGAACAVLGLLSVPVVRHLSLGLAVFCVGAFAGGLFVRGSAYAGRFSVQLIPVGAAMAVSSLALVLKAAHAREVEHE
jgi:hypothetical protein